MEPSNYNSGHDRARIKFQRNPFSPPHPSRILICASSGYGKSTTLMSLINDFQDWYRILLAVRSPEQYIYREFLDRVNPLLTEAGLPPVEVVSTVADIPPLTSFNPEHQNLAVFDDLILVKGAGAIIADFFVAGRPRNITSIVLSQSYISVQKEIRENLSFLMIGSPLKATDATRMFQDHGAMVGVPAPVARALFMEMWQKANEPTRNEDGKLQRHFFTIDKATVVPILKYRRDFSDLWNQETRRFEPWTVERLIQYMVENQLDETHI